MKLSWLVLLCVFFLYCTKDEPEGELVLIKYEINETENYNLRDCNLIPGIKIKFSTQIDKSSIEKSLKIYGRGQPLDILTELIDNDSTIYIRPEKELSYLTKYYLFLDQNLQAKNGKLLTAPFQASFTTMIDSTDKFPRITDGELLDLVQSQTFRYFWDFGHPASGMARERNTSGDLVTSGGTGFGLMAIIVGIERGFINRQQGLERTMLITDFLLTKADRFNGVFPHWLNGISGKTIPFSQKDDGGDLVETSFLLAGLLSSREYFNGNDDQETLLRDKITTIWETVEWSWHTRNGEKVLYWHWSPNYGWDMNHKIGGYNEALITYILAASSPTFPVSTEVYTEGWANKGNIRNGKSFYGYTLPLGYDYGGPLFFAHYSFLGIDPDGLSDQYADYWTQVVNHSKINHAYCSNNPRNFNGYSDLCWGLTASDSNSGYKAHSPTNDHGVITPTAALSSFPYTPEESMNALKYFYYVLGNRTFREYGFIDAFNLHDLWFADSFLAIDQGPIVVMIENYRSGLIWNLLMNSEDVRKGLIKLGFSSQKYNF